MSSSQYAAPLILEPAPSWHLAAGLALAHGATLALVLFLPVHGGWRAALGVIIVISAWRSISLHALRRGKRSVVYLTWDRENRWFIKRRDGHVEQVKLLGDSLLLRALVVLNFKSSSNRRFSVLLLDDCLPSDRFRQLRVRLRISSASDEDASDQGQR